MIVLNSDFKKYIANHPAVENLSERKLKKITRESLKEILKFWFANIFPKRFTLFQHSLYPMAFKKKKKNNGITMVDSGEFRDRITNEIPKIRGTYKGASMKLLYGRPSYAARKLSAFAKEANKPIKEMDIEVRKSIFGFMRGRKIKFDDAKKQLIEARAKKAVYSAKTKSIFKQGLVAVNSQDTELMQAKLEEIILSKLKGGV